MARAANIGPFKGEEVLYDLRPTWGKYFWHVAVGILLSWTLVGLYPIYSAWRDRRNVRYLITTDRLIRKQGGLLSSVDDCQIANLVQLRSRRSFGEKVLGGGTLLVKPARGDPIRFDAVPKHSKVLSSIRRRQQEIDPSRADTIASEQ